MAAARWPAQKIPGGLVAAPPGPGRRTNQEQHGDDRPAGKGKQVQKRQGPDDPGGDGQPDCLGQQVTAVAIRKQPADSWPDQPAGDAEREMPDQDTARILGHQPEKKAHRRQERQIEQVR